MNKIITEDTEKLVIENMRLVYLVLSDMNFYKDTCNNYEDLMQVGNIALVKASRNYDETKSKFSTYAYSAIKTDIIRFIAKQKKEVLTDALSIYDTSLNDYEENPRMYVEFLEDKSEKLFFENLNRHQLLEKTLNLIFNCLSYKEKLIILYRIADLRTRQIASEFNVSYQRVSEIHIKIRNKLKKFIHDDVVYKEKYKVNIITESDITKVRIIANNINDYGSIIEKISYEKENNQIPTNFFVKCIGNEMIFEIPANQEDFYTLARVVKIIEEPC